MPWAKATDEQSLKQKLKKRGTTGRRVHSRQVSNLEKELKLFSDHCRKAKASLGNSNQDSYRHLVLNWNRAPEDRVQLTLSISMGYKHNSEKRGPVAQAKSPKSKV